MSWYIQIGVDKDILKKINPEKIERQTYIFSCLCLMLIALSVLCFFSSMVFTLIVFQNWFISIAVGLFLGLVVYNLYRLFVMTALVVSGGVLHGYHSDHEKHYFDHHERGSDMTNILDEKIHEITSVSKDKLREKTKSESAYKIKGGTDLLTMSIRVAILLIIAIVFANGIELFIFKNAINGVLEDLKYQYTVHGENWIVDNILTPPPNGKFYILDTNSLLLSIEILNRGLGYWKIVIDIVFLFIFLLPLVLIFKSNEIITGEYVQELALSEITISFYHYLHTQRLCQNITKEIKKKEIIFTKEKALKGSV